MFDNRPIDIDTDACSIPESANPEISRVDNYRAQKERAERQLRESIAKLPRWRRRIMETALYGGWR